MGLGDGGLVGLGLGLGDGKTIGLAVATGDGVGIVVLGVLDATGLVHCAPMDLMPSALAGPQPRLVAVSRTPPMTASVTAVTTATAINCLLRIEYQRLDISNLPMNRGRFANRYGVPPKSMSRARFAGSKWSRR
jgi:hypothetical protein